MENMEYYNCDILERLKDRLLTPYENILLLKRIINKTILSLERNKKKKLEKLQMNRVEVALLEKEYQFN